MKVYIVLDYFDEIIKVFKNKEDADNFVMRDDIYWKDYRVEEFDLH